MSPTRRTRLRNPFDVVPAKHRTRPLAAGLIVIALITLALVSAALRHVPLSPVGGHIMRAAFTAADQVSGRTVVRVAGVQVGEVDSVGPGPDPYRTSVVSMRITNNAVHLHRDATAQIRWRTVFGGLVYIDLHPGSPSSPLLGDATIPASQTSNQVELDQILDAYSGPSAEEQRGMLTGLRDTFAAPSQIGRSVRALAPGLDTLHHGLAPLLGTQAGDLRGLVEAGAKTLSGLADTSELQALVVAADRTLAVTDAERTPLGQTLGLLPASLRSTITTMRRLRTTLNHLDPLAHNLRPGARDLAPAARSAIPALTEADSVLRDARPLLQAAGPTLDALRGASATGVTLMRELDPTLTRSQSDLLPWLGSRDSDTHLRIYESIGPFLSSIDSAASEYDSVGHRIRLSVPPAISGFLTAAPALEPACDLSGIAHRVCPALVRALTRSWFTPPASRRSGP
jgi:ABC-type transporter Mla subunit MlaD